MSECLELNLCVVVMRLAVLWTEPSSPLQEQQSLLTLWAVAPVLEPAYAVRVCDASQYWVHSCNCTTSLQADLSANLNFVLHQQLILSLPSATVAWCCLLSSLIQFLWLSHSSDFIGHLLFCAFPCHSYPSGSFRWHMLAYPPNCSWNLQTSCCF